MGEWVTTIVVDSMQVYREVPVITNQARTRPAEMVGVASVAEDWSVAHHKEGVEQVISSLKPSVPFVLDGGTGMYLNAIVLGVPMAPKVPERVRAEAKRLAIKSGEAENLRRETRRLELELAGAAPRSSIWQGGLCYDASFVFLHPDRDTLDRNIRTRSARIALEGREEAIDLAASAPNASVRESIGAKEMMLYASGELSITEAEESIYTRTRRLARRQIRWFDKLRRCLPEKARILVVENTQDRRIKHWMHDTIGRCLR